MGKTLNARLLAAARFVRGGAVLADIGTDHAYLPRYLCKTDHITRAIAADIAKGPLEIAREHVMESGYGDRIELVLTDGRDGIRERGVTDVSICGMGGELIASILEREGISDPSLHLILQPQTRAAHLRHWLSSHGFLIEKECVAKDRGRLYAVLICRYTGESTTLTEREAEIGAYNLLHPENENVRAYIEAYDAQMEKIAREKALAGTKTRKRSELYDNCS